MTHPERIYPEEIAKDLGFSRRHVVDRLAKRPDFPKRTKIGQRIWWQRSEYQDWLEKQRGN